MSKCWCGRDLNTAGICPVHHSGVETFIDAERRIEELEWENEGLRRLRNEMAQKREEMKLEIRRLREALESLDTITPQMTRDNVILTVNHWNTIVKAVNVLEDK